MCGIGGIVCPDGIKVEQLQAMSARLHHRGPDGEGWMGYSVERGIQVRHGRAPAGSDKDRYRAGFVHTRLAIIDLSENSQQPMVDELGQLCLVFNGEIYNYCELRAELRSAGYTFRTEGDTEVLLRAYQAWGPECLSRLNGMWAFALLDTSAQCVIVSRDRFGIKPLYYSVRDDAFYFASEIKSLLAVSGIARQPNERVVAKFLRTGVLDDAEETCFRDIFKIPAASWLSVPINGSFARESCRRFWSIPSATFEGTEREAIRHLRDLVLDAVRIHLRSDVPVGTCLSGGLDSSSIVCSADLLRKRHSIENYPHLTFGYCSEHEESDESGYMGIVAEATRCKLHKVHVEEDEFCERLPEILRTQDEPVGSASIIAQWYVFQRAKAEGIKVVLDGQGADETIAGYHFYFRDIAAAQLAGWDVRGYWRLRNEYQRKIGRFPLSIPSSAVQLISGPYPGVARAITRVARRRRSDVIDRVLTPLRDGAKAAEATEHECQDAGGDLNGRLAQDLQRLILPALLRYEDRNSMAHSIEARVPFLDYRLVDFLFTLPGDWKIRGVTTKYVLREAMQGILPEVIRTRVDKIGFKAAPSLTLGYAGRYRAVLDTNVTDHEQRWFRPNAVESLLHGARTAGLEFDLWRVINVKLWARQFWG